MELFRSFLPEDDLKTRNPDITRARDILNWEPAVTIEQGLVKTADWMREAIS